MTLRRALVCVAALSSLFPAQCDAQHFRFVNAPSPVPRHILSLFRFFAYVPSDPPPLSWKGHPLGLSTEKDWMELGMAYVPHLSSGGNGVLPTKEPGAHSGDSALRRRVEDSPAAWLKPEIFADGQRGLESSVLVFDNVHLQGKADGARVQLAILGLDDFTSFVSAAKDPHARLCCTESDVQDGFCPSEQEGSMIFPSTLQQPPALVPLTNKPISAVSKPLPESGVYVLLLGNCGTTTSENLAINGAVYLKNYFGYLPGVEAPKVSLYFLATIVYVLLGAAWAIQCLRFRTQLIQLHKVISGVIVVGLLESILWLNFYRHWNDHVRRSDTFFALVIIVTVVKNILSFMLVLVTCMGWGTTTPSLPSGTKGRIALTVVLYTVFDSARELMTQFRLAYQLPLSLVALCLFPVSLLHAIIFFWIFNSLARLMEQLRAKRQTRKLRVFTRFYKALLITLVAAVVVLLSQVALMTWASSAWRQEWVFCDLAPLVFYLAVLATVMWLWRPNRQSKTMAYADELPSTDFEATEHEKAVEMAEMELAEMEATYAAMGFSGQSAKQVKEVVADEDGAFN